MTIQRFAAVGVAATLLMGLSACGDSNGDSNQPVAVVPTVTTDAFVVIVQSTVASSTDNTEPVGIDGVVVTTPQTTEPISNI